MKSCAPLVVLVALSACRPMTASSYEFRDGTDGYALTCDSAEECIRDAKDACGGKFTVMSSRGEDYVRTTSRGSAYTNQWGLTTASGSAETHAARRVHLLVKCKDKQD